MYLAANMELFIELKDKKKTKKNKPRHMYYKALMGLPSL